MSEQSISLPQGLSVDLSVLRSRWVLPTAAAVLMLVVISVIEPAVMTSLGLSLILSTLIPLIFAALAQMFVVCVGDVDLGVGAFIGLVNVVVAVTMAENAAWGAIALIGLIAAYAAMGVLIAARGLPSIIVTLGMSFVWLGLAVIVLPSPGGEVPNAVVDAANISSPVVPIEVILIVVVTAVVGWAVARTKAGALLRAAGSNPAALGRAGRSPIVTKGCAYGLAGIFATLSGLMLSGQTASGDANGASSFVLLSIAAVIIGGGSFRGGDISVVGSVAGALVIGLIASLLQLLDISSNYQVGTQGLVLIVILAARTVIERSSGSALGGMS